MSNVKCEVLKAVKVSGKEFGPGDEISLPKATMVKLESNGFVRDLGDEAPVQVASVPTVAKGGKRAVVSAGDGL